MYFADPLKLYILASIAIFIALSGCLFLWKDSSNVAHSVAHASSFPIALSLFSVHIKYEIASVVIVVIFLLLWHFFEKYSNLTRNMIISVLGNVLMIAGILLDLVAHKSTGINTYLIGDIFLASFRDATILLLITLGIFAYFSLKYRQILLAIIYKRGGNYLMIFLGLVGLLMTCKMIGMLASSLLFILIPATAKNISRSIGDMIGKSLVISFVVIYLSYFLTIYFDFYFLCFLALTSLILFVFSNLFRN